MTSLSAPAGLLWRIRSERRSSRLHGATRKALTRAAERGIKLRIYLDGSQLAEREPTKVFEDLAHTSVEIRLTRENSAFMQLKSYEVDGQMLRAGAANFSASGEKR